MKQALVVLAAVLLAVPALAQDYDRGFYFSVKFGSTDVDAELDDTFDQVIDGDEDSTTYEVGFKFNRFFGVQAGYHDFSKYLSMSTCPACTALTVPVEAETTAYSLAIVPQLDLFWRLSVFGKAGVVFTETELDSVIGDTREFIDDFSDEDIIYGVGARFRLISNLSVFAEWESIAEDLETVSVGATLQF